MKKFISIAMLSVFMFTLGGCSSVNKKMDVATQEKTIIKIGTTLDGDYLKELIDTFNIYYPNTIIESKVYDFQSIEDAIDKDEVDIVYGLSETELKKLQKEDKLYQYKSKEYDNIKDQYKNNDNYYIGIGGFTPVIAYNKEILKKENLSLPKDFNDLKKDEYKNKVIMPSEDTTMYEEIVKSLGKDNTEKIYENAKHTSKFNHSIAEVLNNEEIGIVIVPDYEGLFSAWDDGNVELIYSNPINVMVEGVALIDNKEVKPQHKEFVDWVLGEEAMNVMRKNRALLSKKEIKSIMPGSDREEYEIK